MINGDYNENNISYSTLFLEIKKNLRLRPWSISKCEQSSEHGDWDGSQECVWETVDSSRPLQTIKLK